MKMEDIIFERTRCFILINTWKKTCLLTLVFIVSTICARVCMKSIEEIHTMDIKCGTVINPDGALSPVRRHVQNRGRHAQNMRQYFSGVDTSFSLKIDSSGEDSDCTCEYRKNPVNDKAHINVGLPKKTCIYLQAFTVQMINMFPSEEGLLSIESSQSDSFYRFMREYKSKKDAVYLLAALLLLSEGVDIPLYVDASTTSEEPSTVLSLKAENCAKFYINLEMWLDKTVDGKKVEPVYQKKTEDIVKFFKQLNNPRCSLEVPSIFAETGRYEEFITGNFLCSPKFLIQSYFFEYIDSTDMYKDFVKAVHTLLEEQISHAPSEESVQTARAKRVFSCLFAHKAQIEKGVEYISHLQKIDAIKDAYMVLPFTCSAQVPAHTNLPEYDRSEERFKFGKCVCYVGRMESILLSLFCCIVFSPVTKKYSTAHLPDASPGLKHFFSQYRKPKEYADYIMQRDWSKVVAGLPSARVSYIRKSRNKIAFGLINMLYAISDVVGQSTCVEDAIFCLKCLLSKEKLSAADQSEVQSSLQSVFESLSVNKNVKVKCHGVEVNSTYNGWKDLFTPNGTCIEIVYAHNNTCAGVNLKMEYAHPTITLASNIHFYQPKLKAALTNMKTRYSSAATHTECMMLQYAEDSLQRIQADDATDCMPGTAITATMNRGYSNTNSLLLCSSLDNLACKSRIVETFLIHSNRENVKCNNSMARFTANLIGSAPLDDRNVRQSILRGCVFNMKYKYYYPQINYDVLAMPKAERLSVPMWILFESIFSPGLPKHATINSCISLLSVYSNTREIFREFASEYVCLNILNRLCKDYILDKPGDSLNKINANKKRGAAALSHILQTMKSHISAQNNYTVNDIYICWLVYACSKSKNFREFIPQIYMHINHTDMSDRFKNIIGKRFSDKDFCNVQKFIEKEWSLFFKKGNKRGSKKYCEIEKFFAEYKKEGPSRAHAHSSSKTKASAHRPCTNKR
ncbi:hypothetical protein NEPAR06_2350 [Nematocida parisii]|uniref:Uncharacterized protein n=1 Tax=Nematocida parisii (strain ERTm3) TaxID=935791 RepID=I3ED75_NEMP3|nr:uncharacterized protein NEPG_02599 [Nematocida parisii ERTm1]EIJ87172.1 hypothetical protein NEQG_02629 [Nematocida parisii ERTm3]KAI5146350.1 hypothetical protein NEPAR07_2313 [Nematocida parisii]EIJ92530.1 hypothetical protein NEPG_02599 [Nematocida parisii ERTm1]KAI5157029.1 hypothetical protein NEPAR06_2350 [Nematocida parisii]KAI5157262.1 hypothetical protein NEPAR05_1144 [Nematocida parisii]|eukprot:XP_013060426.1 hypothetical protein NEPG_02599 [Nematocida parisii ERTm1]